MAKNQIAVAPSRRLGQMLSVPEQRKRLDDALGGVIPADYFREQMIVAFAMDPKLRGCSVESQFKAVLTCASLAMVPSNGHVALIPRSGDVDVMIQWQGYKSLMERHETVKDVSAHLVHVTDSYSYDPETGAIVDHKFDPFDEDRNFESLDDIRGGYLIVKFKDGTKKYHFVRRRTIEKARACAQTRKIWDQWLEQMSLKTIYRDAYGRRVVPMDPLINSRLSHATEFDDDQLGNDPGSVVTTEVVEVTPASRAKQMAEEVLSAPAPPPEEPKVYAPEPEDVMEPEPVQASAPPKQAPSIPGELAEYGEKLMACRTENGARNLWHKYVGNHVDVMDDEVFAAGTNLRDWKVKQLKARQHSKQQELV